MMKKPIQGLLASILLLVGVLEMNLLLIGLGILGLVSISGACFVHFKKQQKKKQASLAMTVGLNQYLEQYHFLQISEHVTLKREKVLDDYTEAQLYFDDELCGTLQDLKNIHTMADTYEKIANQIHEISRLGEMVDDNRNGVDDRLEQDRRYAYYIAEIKQYLALFQKPALTSGLKEASTLLTEIGKLEEKYPQLSPRLRKLYQQYLPLLSNILAQYKVLLDKHASSAEIDVVETKLEKTILLVNEALKTMMSNFIADDLINVSSDITVLEALLKRDGLVQDGTLGGMSHGQ